MPLVVILLTMAWLHQKVAGYPIGGSLAFARTIERRYLALGGGIEASSLSLSASVMMLEL